MEVSGLRRGLVWVIALAIAYGLFSLAWSTMAFLYSYRLPFIPEYEGAFPITEIGGHILFGLSVGVFFGRARLAGLCGLLAASIDADHLLSITVAPVLDRSAHSLIFMLVAATILSIAASRRWSLDSGVFFVAVASVLSHLSYDAFLANARFPLLFPFSIQNFAFPQASWAIFEALGIGVALAWRLRASRVLSVRAKPGIEPAPVQKLGRPAGQSRQMSAKLGSFLKGHQTYSHALGRWSNRSRQTPLA